jgi:outer membrane protein TolC
METRLDSVPEPRAGDTMSALDRTILERRSIRKFLPLPVPRKIINEALALAQHAPSNSIASGLVGPIFSGGRIKQGYEAAKARFEQGKVQYEAAVTNSLREVSGALVDRAKLVETERQRVRTVTAYTESVRIANLRYRSGRSAYFEVLDAQQQLFPAEISLVETQRDQPVAVVSLYKALGGGWPNAPGGPPSGGAPGAASGERSAPSSR